MITKAVALFAVSVLLQAAPVLKDQYASVNGVRLHYVSAGEGPLILFLHGFPEFWYEWKSQLLEFGKDHRAVAPDMRGYNLSEKPKELEQYRMNVLVEDVQALAEQLSPGKKFVLVAHDWGGAIAWAYAMAHPERLEKLVIINAPHPAVFGRLLRSDPEQQKASQYMLMFRGPKAEETLSANSYESLVRGVLGVGTKGSTITEEDKKEYLKAWSQPGGLTGGLNYYRANELGPPQPGAPVKAITSVNPAAFMVRVPTLVIWGEKDTALLTQNLEGLEQYVPSMTVKRIPDATHWVVREKTAEVNTMIREFLRP